jgi:hypothetical protein
LLIALVGLGWGFWVVDIYSRTKMLAVGYSLICVLLMLGGMFSLFCGIMLHSMRGLLLELASHKNK